ncbi:MAG: hypothetical protein KBT46_00525 [Ruminococcus sp.]|nr:hypothetical protein [Candidatus Copronaster equi]
MIEVVSNDYIKENCVCFERKIKAESLPFAVKIVPNDGYVLKRTFKIDDEEHIEYVSGWAQLPMNNIDKKFSEYEAVFNNSLIELS